MTSAARRFPILEWAVGYQPAWLRFDVVAGFLWAGYAALLGYFGGRAFEQQPWKGFLLAFGIALAITGGVELYRWMKRRGVLARG